MDTIRDFFGALVELFTPISRAQLSEFQKKKLIHEFNTFYDKNKDGSIQWKDFEIAREHICQLSGWKEGNPKYKKSQELFVELWSNLQVSGDSDTDGKITKDEWLMMWTSIYRAKLIHERDRAKARAKEGEEESTSGGGGGSTEDGGADSYIPAWFHKYIEYKFNLYDRAGDGVLDMEEFEFTLCDGFNMSTKDCRNAFTMFAEGGQKRVDLPYFRQLSLEFYLSNDPGALGNFINGKLSYE